LIVNVDPVSKVKRLGEIETESTFVYEKACCSALKKIILGFEN
jgi:hypothetical protein